MINNSDTVLGCQFMSNIKGESHFSVLPLPLCFACSRESKGCPNSRFDRGVGLRGRGRYPLKPSIFASLLETKGYPEHTAARSSRQSHKCKYFRLKYWFKNYESCFVLYTVLYIYICNHVLNWNVFKNRCFSMLTLHCWFVQHSRISLARENITKFHEIDIHIHLQTASLWSTLVTSGDGTLG